MSTFEKLKRFISKDMRMSAVYQPVMLIELIKNNGSASVSQIAQAILNRDPSQIEYYSLIVKNMVGKVLTKNRAITEKHGEIYSLKNFADLSRSESDDLIRLCEKAVGEFEIKRNGSHWNHRRRGRRPVSGTIRYEVLKRAQFRCELCGISAEEKNLEVDHIEPKSKGGADDLSNFQALCFTCNSQKNNKDQTDFRGMGAKYDHRDPVCVFCNWQKPFLHEHPLAFVIQDGFPISPGHSLIIPKRHCSQYFELTQSELNSVHSLILKRQQELQKSDPSIQGFNIGMNCGEIAGQTIMHSHIHLIPRRLGDVTNPRGGVRNIFPGKGDY
jgi:diadenosine tetraphosphate (Ap4A) HIT family hydrolase/5-methylcytosine-specific restriction endonuclease McrA